MDSEDITQDDLLAEVAAFVVAQQDKRPGSDWFLTMEMFEKASAVSDIGYDRFHDILQELVRDGKMERQKVGSKIYYRKLG